MPSPFKKQKLLMQTHTDISVSSLRTQPRIKISSKIKSSDGSILLFFKNIFKNPKRAIRGGKQL